MKQISNKEYEEYQAYKIDLIKGRVLTTDGIRLIVEANNHDPMRIGKVILDGYNKAIAGKRGLIHNGSQKRISHRGKDR